MSRRTNDPQALLVGPTQFMLGYQPQRQWSWLIATAFFFGKVGAGTFLISLLVGFKLGMLVGILVVAVLKTTAHLLFLGRPERFLRALWGWKTSWISRGIHAMGIFIVFGLLRLAPSAFSFPHGAAKACGIVAAVAAVFVMFYDGFVMKASRGIPLWDSYLTPLLVLAYAFLGGTTLTLALEVAAGRTIQHGFEWFQVGLILLNLGLLAVLVLSARVRGAAADLAASLLVRGALGRLFLAVAIGVGIGATLVLVGVAIATGNHAILVAAAVSDLVGEFFVFFSILRAGVHPPVRPVAFLRRAAAVAGT